MDLIGTPAITKLAWALNAMAGRQSVLAANLANIETPGYRRLDVDFQSVLHEAEERGTLPEAPRLVQEPFFQRADSNGVQLEREMVGLSETVMLYQATARQMAYQFTSLRHAITEGRQ